MPEHVLMPEVEMIPVEGQRRRWMTAERLRIVEETLDEKASIAVVARRNRGGEEPALLMAQAHAEFFVRNGVFAYDMELWCRQFRLVRMLPDANGLSS